MIVTISIEGMEFKAYHGCYELEKVVGNRFRVDVSIDAEVGDAARKDALNETVNYLSVYELVAVQMKQNSDTIENVAYRIADSLKKDFEKISSVTVKVSKLAPPLGGKVERVSVTVKI